MITTQSGIVYINETLFFEFDRKNASRLYIIEELHYLNKRDYVITITWANSLEITF